MLPRFRRLLGGDHTRADDGATDLAPHGRGRGKAGHVTCLLSDVALLQLESFEYPKQIHLCSGFLVQMAGGCFRHAVKSLPETLWNTKFLKRPGSVRNCFLARRSEIANGA